ncbi:MAG TPA: epoxide hydrolase [Polyangiaceae bacterium]|jgi:pimeloyl-ACP methyl ester carboxylesterase
MAPEPFRIRVDQHVLDDLQLRLEQTRWPSVIEHTGWETGTSSAFLHELVGYWQSGYDWRAEEAKLNELAQFKARVDGAALHFVHERGRGPRPMPLLLLHGWPDSFFRYHKVISRFSDPARAGGSPSDSFDVVVPSLPGFPFTSAVERRAGDQPMRHSAQLLWRLMTEQLGYARFAVAGGDGGSALAQILAIDHPEAVVGIHLTDLGWRAPNADPASLSKTEQKYLAASKKHFIADGAYAMVQMTRPRSLAAGLNDSPVGLASWILDRFHAWSEAGDLEQSFGKDDLLTNIMLYWVTQSIGSSIFTYYADARSPSLTTADLVRRPVALALFPKDVGGVPPQSLAERTLNVRRWTEMPRGGHFAALEEPELFENDVSEFFRPLRIAF